MRPNPRYYVKHEKLTREMTREALKSQQNKEALEKQREEARSAVTQERRNRDSLLSNPETKFIRSRNSNTIHHVLCENIKEITDNNFRVFKGSITKDSKLCSSCKRLVWIALGIGDKRSSIPICNAFFNYLRIYNQLLEELFVTYKAQVIVINIYRLQITVNGETWILSRTGKNHKVRILHNNYCMTEDGRRVSMLGFHEQYKKKEMTGVEAIRCILNYRNH